MFDSHRTSSPLNSLPSLVAALSWGAMFPIAASALHRVDAFPLTAIRYGVAAVVFLGLLYAVEGRQGLRPPGPPPRVFVPGSLRLPRLQPPPHPGPRATPPAAAPPAPAPPPPSA